MFNWHGSKRILAIALYLICAPRAGALIFSQLGESYDHQHNRIDWQVAWERGHMIGSLHGANGTAVAPFWFLTAAHLRHTQPKIFDTLGGSFFVQEMVPLRSGDMMLCRVDKPFPKYSALLKEPTRTGEVVRIYGQSSSHWAKEPIKDATGRVKGWTRGAEDQRSMALRQGLGRLHNASVLSFSWPFSAYDPDVSTNAAAAQHMDSGGGVFVGNALAGILTRASMIYTVRPEGGRKELDCYTGFILDVTNLFNCTQDTPTHPYHFTATLANAVAANLDEIYRIISPPIRVDAGGQNHDGWTGWTGGYRRIEVEAGDAGESQTAASISDHVYRTMVFAQGTNRLSFAATNLLRSELYTVRLHFGEFPFLEPGEVQPEVYVNGSLLTREFDPVEIASRGRNKEKRRAVLELRNMKADDGNRMLIELAPGGRKQIAFLSGLEILRQERRSGPVQR